MPIPPQSRSAPIRRVQSADAFSGVYTQEASTTANAPSVGVGNTAVRPWAIAAAAAGRIQFLSDVDPVAATTRAFDVRYALPNFPSPFTVAKGDSVQLHITAQFMAPSYEVRLNEMHLSPQVETRGRGLVSSANLYADETYYVYYMRLQGSLRYAAPPPGTYNFYVEYTAQLLVRPG